MVECILLVIFGYILHRDVICSDEWLKDNPNGLHKTVEEWYNE